ncbi:Kelch motif protein [Neolewinella xylanilytica]|uniref:Kelch motif protein n=1 Tax=Neolewinella xylanilytica TaxID=1514080 RepID=A0A2S6I1E8_9BACT|nr:kelch repeat-containing protein [Neolewinella xylanilytica]PPK84790.1 Kelch motif protein [Neolewinella xylanilytica]
MKNPLPHLLGLGLLACVISCSSNRQAEAPAATDSTLAPRWSPVSVQTRPTARHEAAFTRAGDYAYLLGGRGIKPVDILDPKTTTWSQGPESPVEIHHFQPVVVGQEVYLMGAMTGGWPGEPPLPNIWIYDTEENSWRKGPEIPADRRRGGAGAVLHEGSIYLVCGIQDGHRSGHVAWLDRYDLETGAWTRLADAPRARDHFQAVVHDGKIYAVAGRRSQVENGFSTTIGEVDVYDIASETWTTLPDTLPTPRAGNAAAVVDGKILVIGGESGAQELAHADVEALDPITGTWRSLPPLSRGRHGTGVVQFGDQLYMAAGCGKRGGEPELDDLIGASIDR